MTRLLMLLPAAEPGGQPFFVVAGHVLAGHLPYRDLVFEYPPGALLPMLLPGLFGLGENSYSALFALQMVLIDLWIALSLMSLTRRISPTPSSHGEYVALAWWVVAPVMLGSVAWHRFDLLMVALVVAAVDAWLKRRHARADVLLALAVWVNVVPALLLPLLWLHASTGRRRAARTMMLSALRFAAASAVLWLPVVFLVGIKDLLGFARYQLERGLDLESSWAGVAMLAEKLGLGALSTAWDHGAFHLAGGIADGLSAIATPLLLLLLSGILAGLALLQLRQKTSEDNDSHLLRGIVMMLTALVLGSKVLSAQFLLWPLPLAIVLAVTSNRVRDRAVIWALLAATGLTWLIFPTYYDVVQRRDAEALALLTARSLCVLVALLLGSGLLDGLLDRWRARPRFSSVLAHAELLAWLCLGCYAIISSLYPVLDDDIWFHLRVGFDILSSGQIPGVDVYSATAAGRSFVAHSWLAEVLLAWVGQASDQLLLPVVRAALVALILAVLWATSGVHLRAHRLGFWIALLTVEGLTAHLELRPYLFGVLGAATMGLIIERWWRTGAWTPLLALLPLSTLWANLHGSFLLLPAFLLATSASAWLTGQARHEGQTTPGFVVPLALVPLCLLASLVNPYGVDLLTHSWQMFSGNDYIKRWIVEWQPLFASIHRQRAEYLITVGWLALWASSVALHWKRRPLRDLVSLIFALSLLIPAYRFAAYAFVLGLPTIARLWCEDSSASAPRGSRPWVGLGVVGTLLLATLGLGVHHQQLYTVPLGLGVHPAPARTAVSALLDRGFRGNLLCAYRDGSYVLYAAPGVLRPVIDARIDVYGPQLANEFFEATTSGGGQLQRYLDLHDVRLALLTRGQLHVAARELLRDPAWQVLWSDHDAAVLHRSVPGQTSVPPASMQ
ncbi:MAG: glycosyltransferase 87 family protein [Pseudomonadota bacterium]